MLSIFANTLFVLTAFAPVLFTWGFVRFRQTQHIGDAWPFAAAALFLIFACIFIVRVSKKQLPDVKPFSVLTVKAADGELLTFVIAYLLPLVNVNQPTMDWWAVGFILVLLMLIVGATHAYQFNPLLALFGYHFYEVTTKEGVTFLMFSERRIRAVKDVRSVKQIAAYVVMDSTSDQDRQ